MNENEVTTLQLFYNPFADANGRTFLSFAGKTERDAYYDNQAENGKSKKISLDCFLMENDTRDIDDIYENLKGYNYARSKNALGEWVYYFITKFDYTNTDVTKITLSIDNVTTYLFGGSDIRINGTIERAHVDRWIAKSIEGEAVQLYPVYYEGTENFYPKSYMKTDERSITNGKEDGFVVFTCSGNPFYSGYDEIVNAPDVPDESWYGGISYKGYPKTNCFTFALPLTPDETYKTSASKFLSYIVTGQNNDDIDFKSAHPELTDAQIEALRHNFYLGFKKQNIISACFFPFQFSQLVGRTENYKPTLTRFGAPIGTFFHNKISLDVLVIKNVLNFLTISSDSNSIMNYVRYTKEQFYDIETKYFGSVTKKYDLESRLYFYPFSYSEVKFAGAAECVKRQYMDNLSYQYAQALVDLGPIPSVFFWVGGDTINEKKKEINTSAIFSFPIYNDSWETYYGYEKAMVNSQMRYEKENSSRSEIVTAAKGAVGGFLAGGGYGAAMGAALGYGYSKDNEAIRVRQKEEENELKEMEVFGKPETPQTSTSGNMQFLNGNAEMTSSDFDIPEGEKWIFYNQFYEFGYTINKNIIMMKKDDFINFIRSRHYFNYAKFSDISIIASVPNDTKQDLCSKLLSGATFYKVLNNEITFEEEGAIDKDNIEETIKAYIGL